MVEESQKHSKKKTESVKERAERSIAEASKAAKPVKKKSTSKKKLSLLRRKKSYESRIKNRRLYIIPNFFKESYRELRSVTWPDRRTTLRLTLAVIIFSIIFGAIISLVDYGFGIIFKKVFLHG